MVRFRVKLKNTCKKLERRQRRYEVGDSKPAKDPSHLQVGDSGGDDVRIT